MTAVSLTALKQSAHSLRSRIEAFFRRSELTRALATLAPEFKSVGIFSLIVNLLMLAPTLYMLQVFDRIMISQNTLTLIVLSLITLFLFCAMAFGEYIRSRILVRTGVKLDQMLSPRVFAASFEARLQGGGNDAAPQEALGDLTRLRQFLTGNGVFAAFDAPWTPVYLLVICLLSPWLGLLALVFAAVFAGMAMLTQAVSEAPQKAVAEAARHDTRFAQSKLRNADVIESLGMLDSLRNRWLGYHRNHLKVNAMAYDISHRITSSTKFLTYSQQSLVLGAGALLVINDMMSVGSMIAANVLMGRALQPINQIVSSWRSFFEAYDAFLRVEKLLEDHPERQNQLTPTDIRGDLRLVDLVAPVAGRETPILKGLNAHFPAGSVTAIIGPSGSGKSTLARCLLGIWPGMQGRVELDDEPIERWERNDLGSWLGYLPQDVELFDGSIADNIARFGEPEPEKVIAAARTAGMHEMILRFPKGYDTPMGEAGNVLSGGQRQRIALARALYGNPSVVVLDEPNANLDSDGEAALRQAILQMKQDGRTVFLITHRPQIVGVVDHILVLVQGQIQHFGPRDAVLQALQPPQPAQPPQPPASS